MVVTSTTLIRMQRNDVDLITILFPQIIWETNAINESVFSLVSSDPVNFIQYAKIKNCGFLNSN